MRQIIQAVLAVIILLIIYKIFVPFENFKRSWFDSPDLPGSGSKMDWWFLFRLDLAITFSGVKLTEENFSSGYRTPQYNAGLDDAVSGSAHTKGLAVDIRKLTQSEIVSLIKWLKFFGFKRFGIGSTFIHVDADETKPQYVAWGYPLGSSAPFNPFS